MILCLSIRGALVESVWVPNKLNIAHCIAKNEQERRLSRGWLKAADTAPVYVDVA